VKSDYIRLAAGLLIDPDPEHLTRYKVPDPNSISFKKTLSRKKWLQITSLKKNRALFRSAMHGPLNIPVLYKALVW
jgi:hypothetical protein